MSYNAKTANKICFLASTKYFIYYAAQLHITETRQGSSDALARRGIGDRNV